MRRPYIILSILFSFFSTGAIAACNFKDPTIFCTSPLNAARAFNQYGFDNNLISQSYTEAILAAANCSRVNNTKNIDITQLHVLRVATPDGWVNVREIDVRRKNENDFIIFIADNYINGKCPQFKQKPIADPPLPPRTSDNPMGMP